jgi:hypothetical protein
LADERVVELVRYYRPFGFFTQWPGASDAQVADEVSALYRATYRRDMSAEEDIEDQYILALDKDRVWWEDNEADMVEGDDFYVQMVHDLGRISRGAFRPEGITERWDDTFGPIHVAFRADGTEHAIELDHGSGWIDYKLVDYIERLIEPFGLRLIGLDTGDQTVMLVALNTGEYERLQRGRPELFDDGEDEYFDEDDLEDDE